MKRVAAEGSHSTNGRQFWFSKRAIRADYKLRAHHITTISTNVPKLVCVVPTRLSNGRIEDGEFVEIIFVSDSLTVSEDFRTT